jgi:peptidoglycan/LPS O-acetylase OafA/YrhL
MSADSGGNPYAPPGAALAQPQRDRPDKPSQVRRAVILLWISLAIGVAESVLNPGLHAQDDLPISILVMGGTYAINALLIHLVSRGRNWARIVLLLLTFAGLSMYMVFPGEVFTGPWWSVTLTGLGIVLDVTALAMLFTGKGAKWYSSRAPA